MLPSTRIPGFLVAVGLAALAQIAFVFADAAEPPLQVGGIYPSLAMFNDEGECGTGAVVPWADRLWVITYAPHKPDGSSDKLYEITPDLVQIVRPESVGGTPANRMIHAETGTLIIGPYLIDKERNVRVLHPSMMPGRLTGNARHLVRPEESVYFATMEEGLYEVNLRTMAVRGLIQDGNPRAKGTKETHPATIASELPGYHGKGLYSGQGRVVYANNGDRDKRVVTDPTTPSGALAEWKGEGDWSLVLRNQFTEVTGPGGIMGSDPNAPIWSVGWDARSLILMMLDGGVWHKFRLPKGSHSYDGAHGWNTEWPRIREIGEGETLLMTMHGLFWRFPKTFAAKTATGIRPRSAYLKVVGDFARWNDRIVLGCDDTAKSEFLNSRPMKNGLAAPGQSNSNLWFVEPERLDQLGRPLAGGAVWLRDKVQARTESDPFLVAGWDQVGATLVNGGENAVGVSLEVGSGDGRWRATRTVDVPAKGHRCIELSEARGAEWVRLVPLANGVDVSAHFTMARDEHRPLFAADAVPRLFAGLAPVGAWGGKPGVSGGIVRVRGENMRTLQLAAIGESGKPMGSYVIDASLAVTPLDDPKADAYAREKAAFPPASAVAVEEGSVLIVDASGRRWRLPKSLRESEAFDRLAKSGQVRPLREVVTERDLLNCHGTFYEVPAENAMGFARVRPVASHEFAIQDFCSYRGLLMMTGVHSSAENTTRIFRSTDGKAAIWIGSVDELWDLGKPSGIGGPWAATRVTAGTVSDPYLIWGYDQRSLTMKHDSKNAVGFRIQLDVTGDGLWIDYAGASVNAGETWTHTFPAALHARWIRFVANGECRATTVLRYD
jgi:hypothetical protein